MNYIQFSDFISKKDFSPFSFHIEKDLSGYVDGQTKNFPLVTIPGSGQIALYYNGLRQRPNSFIITSSGISLKFKPKNGSHLLVDYFI